jgi:hypothetical protein
MTGQLFIEYDHQAAANSGKVVKFSGGGLPRLPHLLLPTILSPHRLRECSEQAFHFLVLCNRLVQTTAITLRVYRSARAAGCGAGYYPAPQPAARATLNIFTAACT